MSDKLDGFGPIYVLNLERSPERQAHMLAEFEKHGITNFSFISAIDGTKDFEAQGVAVEQNSTMVPGEHGCAASHLLALEYWLSTSDSPYAIFFEDDISFELVDKWRFSWKEILQQVPTNFSTLQMCLIFTNWENIQLGLRPRDMANDWSSGAYVIHREYAQQLISRHIKQGSIKTFVNLSVSDSMLFCNPDAYVYPLFVETAKNQTTMVGRDHAGVHLASRDKILQLYEVNY